MGMFSEFDTIIAIKPQGIKEEVKGLFVKSFGRYPDCTNYKTIHLIVSGKLRKLYGKKNYIRASVTRMVLIEKKMKFDGYKKYY